MARKVQLTARRRFENSLTNPKTILKTVLWDVIFIASVIILFLLLSGLITILSAEYMGLANGNVESLLSELSSEELDGLFTYIYGVLITFSIGIIVVMLLTLISYSFTRKKIWALLDKKSYSFKFKNGGWKELFSFLGLAFTFLFLLILGSIPLFLIQGVITWIVYLFGEYITIASFLSQAAGLLWLVFLLQLFFSIKYDWSRKKKLWYSIGDGFSNWIQLIKKNGLDFLLQWGTLVLVSMIIVQALIQLLSYSSMVPNIVQAIIYIFFLSWSRYYFFQIMASSKSNH